MVAVDVVTLRDTSRIPAAWGLGLGLGLPPVERWRLGIGKGSHSTSAEETGTAGTSTDPTMHAASTALGTGLRTTNTRSYATLSARKTTW